VTVHQQLAEIVVEVDGLAGALLPLGIRAASTGALAGVRWLDRTVEQEDLDASIRRLVGAIGRRDLGVVLAAPELVDARARRRWGRLVSQGLPARHGRVMVIPFAVPDARAQRSRLVVHGPAAQTVCCSAMQKQ